MKRGEYTNPGFRIGSDFVVCPQYGMDY